LYFAKLKWILKIKLGLPIGNLEYISDDFENLPSFPPKNRCVRMDFPVRQWARGWEKTGYPAPGPTNRMLAAEIL
jgi:hypothetical protein